MHGWHNAKVGDWQHIDKRDIAESLAALRLGGATVRVVDGRRMKTRRSLFIEFQRAFEFPDYFGHNWDAFDECLGDLEWLSVDGGVAVVISNGDQVLKRRGSELQDLVRALSYAREEWHHTSELSVGSDRPSQRFSVVLQTPVEDLRRWQQAGATFDDRPTHIGTYAHLIIRA